ncbi:MAG: FMN-binding protein [Fidelibacterota bacterium]|jgi:Na+-translocating ferredoxin:NAD+ oxidoreductase RnfG subunit
MKQASNARSIRCLGIVVIKNITNLFLFFCFIATGLHGGIKEDVRKIIRTEYGKSIVFSMKKILLDKEVKAKIEQKVRQRFFKDFIYVWTIEIKKGEKVYGLLDNVKGKSMPITFLVIFDSKGNILNSNVIKYREPYGGEISSPKWMNQFKGRNASSHFAVGNDIDGISGATISVYSMATGVMKLSLLFPLIKPQL